MNIIKFYTTCKKIESDIVDRYKNRGTSLGLCGYLSREISCEARRQSARWFSEQGMAEGCDWLFWLQCEDKEKTYHRRLRYLNKFLWKSILTFKFLDY